MNQMNQNNQYKEQITNSSYNNPYSRYRPNVSNASSNLSKMEELNVPETNSKEMPKMSNNFVRNSNLQNKSKSSVKGSRYQN